MFYLLNLERNQNALIRCVHGLNVFLYVTVEPKSLLHWKRFSTRLVVHLLKESHVNNSAKANLVFCYSVYVQRERLQVPVKCCEERMAPEFTRGGAPRWGFTTRRRCAQASALVLILQQYLSQHLWLPLSVSTYGLILYIYGLIFIIWDCNLYVFYKILK